MHYIANILLKTAGWKLKGRQPKEKKYIIAVAPHTSYKDFIIGKLVAYKMRLDIYFLIKKELFFFPLGYILKAAKALPVNRKAPKALVNTVVQEIRRRKQFILVVTPEGTRKRVTNWKRGFHYIAQKAEIPVLPATIDYKKREVIFGQLIYPGKNPEEDFQKMVEFYKFVNPEPRYGNQFAYPQNKYQTNE